MRGLLDAIWTRLPHEAVRCVACGSPALETLDVLRVRRTPRQPGAAFVSGCRACGVLFVNPMPDHQDVETFYSAEGDWARERAARVERLAEQHARRLAKKKPRKARPIRRRRELLLRALEPYVPVFTPTPGAAVLDFGCGEGKLLDTLQELGWETYGLEPSADVAFVRHRRVHEVPRDGRFDVIVLHHVLEHVPNPLDVLQQLAAGLRENGLLYVIVPRLDTLPQHHDYRYVINGRNHLVAFSETSLRGLLARAGLELVAAVESPEMDEAFTEGKPLRLRVIARKVSRPLPPPARPLDAARRALRGRNAPHSLAKRAAALLPVRMRAAWMLRNR